MKYIKQLALIIIVFQTHNGFTQNTENQIKEIRKHYKEIHENHQSYDSTSIDLEGESTEGGEITYYTKENNLKLMSVWLYFETGKNKIEFYYHNDELFFIFNARYNYNRPMYWDKSTAEENGDDESFEPSKSTIAENRYYFNQNKLIRWISPSGDIEKQVDGDYSISGKDFWTVSDYLSNAKKWSELYKQ